MKTDCFRILDRLSCFGLMILLMVGCAKKSTAPGPASAASPAVPFKITFQLDWFAEPEHGPSAARITQRMPNLP